MMNKEGEKSVPGLSKQQGKQTTGNKQQATENGAPPLVNRKLAIETAVFMLYFEGTVKM